MSSAKPYRIRVRVLDGKPRKWNEIKGELGSHFDVIDAKHGLEFVIGAGKPEQLDQVRTKLGSAGLAEIAEGETTISKPAPTPAKSQGKQHKPPQRSQSQPNAAPSTAPRIEPKPYGFVPLPDNLPKPFSLSGTTERAARGVSQVRSASSSRH